MIGATGELNYFSANIRLRELGKSEDKAEDGTSVEASILRSHGGRVLIANGAEEVENAETNSKYQDRAEAKEFYKTGVHRFLIKIIKNEGLRVDTGVLDTQCCTFYTQRSRRQR
ncbi:hypothetical protein BHE74_00053662 [Ensete ventricosum]|nr:hypothetical protein BHE74_00053662 [Ensete ventricosum]